MFLAYHSTPMEFTGHLGHLFLLKVLLCYILLETNRYTRRLDSLKNTIGRYNWEEVGVFLKVLSKDVRQFENGNGAR